MHQLRLFGIMSFIIFDVASPISGCSNNNRYTTNYKFYNQIVFYYGLNDYKQIDETYILTSSSDYINYQLVESDNKTLELPNGVPESYKGYTFDGWYLMEHCSISDYSSYVSINKKVEFPYTYSTEDIMNTEFIINSLIFAQKRTPIS